MIFFDGEIYENDMCDKLLARFEDRICDTLGNCRLSAKQVMLAAEKISTDIEMVLLTICSQRLTLKM